MKRLTHLNHGLFMLNPDLIEHLEMTPDTVITPTNGHQFMVWESGEEVIGYATKARKNGVVSLEQDAARVEDPFLRKALNLAVDGTDLRWLKNGVTGGVIAQCGRRCPIPLSLPAPAAG
jgi:uncharacterized protein YlzI (FlbEa/FlbD family)